jgi:hypothetical protein
MLQETGSDILDLGEDGAEADPRINWRVTVRRGDYYIHIMALDQGLSRFACSLQTTSDFDEGLRSYRASRHSAYETGNLAQIEHVLDGFYARLKHEDEQRYQQNLIDMNVKLAVEKEREIWRDRLDHSEAKRLQVISLSLLGGGLILLFGINEYFGGRPGRITGRGIDLAFELGGPPIVGGLGAFVGAGFYGYLLFSALDKFGFVDKSGKTTPLIGKIILISSGIVFSVLWAILTYVLFRS